MTPAEITFAIGTALILTVLTCMINEKFFYRALISTAVFIICLYALACLAFHF